MGYEEFVKRYYKGLMAGLMSFKRYNGRLANTNSKMDVPFSYLRDSDENAPDFFPSIVLKDEAPLKCFEEFVEYYGKVMPDLAIVFLTKDKLSSLYIASKNRDGFIEVYLEGAFLILSETKVLG